MFCSCRLEDQVEIQVGGVMIGLSRPRHTNHYMETCLMVKFILDSLMILVIKFQLCKWWNLQVTALWMQDIYDQNIWHSLGMTQVTFLGRKWLFGSMNLKCERVSSLFVKLPIWGYFSFKIMYFWICGKVIIYILFLQNIISFYLANKIIN